jgi:hypothetical protein
MFAAAIVAPLTAASAAAHSPPAGAALMQANENGWHNMSYRPGAIYIGQGGSPFVRYLAWHSWGASSATTRSGQYFYQTNPYCTPSYLCPYSKKPVTVYLHDIKTHRGQPYFAKMRWNYTSRNGYHRSIYWEFEYYPGGSVPFWNYS